MSKKSHRLCALLMVGILSPPIAFSANAPPDSGSKEALKESAIRDTDHFTGKEFMVFESVQNEGYEKQGQFSKMTFYVAPLFRLIPDSETQQVYHRTPYANREVVQYTFFVECFDPRIDEQALKKVNKYYSKTKGEYVFTKEQVHHMRHGKVVIKAGNLPPWVKVQPVTIGTDTPNSTVMLDAVEEFTVNVPLAMDEDFQTRLNSGMKFKFTVYFNVMNISRLQLAWSLDDIRKTSTYKQLKSGGAHYVTAEQVQNMTRQAAEKRNVYYYQDPDIDDKITNKALSLFDNLRAEVQELVVQNRQQAAELEAKLRQGTGLLAHEFKPLTLRWDVYEKLETVDDYHTANKVIQKAYEHSKEAYKKLDDAYQRRQNTASGSSNQYNRDKSSRNQFDMKAGFDYDVSWTEGEGNMYYNHNDQDTESLTEGRVASEGSKSDEKATRKIGSSNIAEDKINQDYFNNADELKAYQAKTTEQKRPKVKIVGRGLNVIERSQFEQNLQTMASFVFVQPMMEAKSFMTDAKISTHSKNDVPSMLEKLKKAALLTDAVSISEEGNVGIGTTSPPSGTKLHITGGSVRVDAGGGGVVMSTPVEGPGIAIFDPTDIQAFNMLSTSTYNRINSDGRPLAITDSNVGIGTTTPNSKLTIGSNPKNNSFIGVKDYYGSGLSYLMSLDRANGQNVFTVHTNTNVGIGTTNPQYKLDVNGTIRGNNVNPSDERFKQNIQTLGGSLAKLSQLRGVSFNWKDEPEDKQIGLVAQEVEKVFPELVSTDSEGYKSIAYGKLTAVLIEAIKELQQQRCQ